VRLTITRKIALAMILTAIVSIGTMAWITSENLKRGFLDYLNDVQARDLERVAAMLGDAWRERGSFDWLRGNPGGMREFFDRLQGRPAGERLADVRDGGWPGGGPPPGAGRYGDGPPRREGRPPRRGGPPPDPMGMGQRLTLLDADGIPVLGPPDSPNAIARPVVVDGRTVGTLLLRPLRTAGTSAENAFLRGQLHEIALLAAALVLLSAGLAGLLARHLLRPVGALRDVTQHIARGDLDARAPVMGRDELAELASHVNAMAESLASNERQRRQMLADVAHELRTPLTVIRGELEALIDGIRQADPAALQSLHAEALHLSKLIDDLHQLALADAGALHYQFAPVDLTAAVDGIVMRYYGRAQAEGLSLETDITSASVWVEADHGRLTQVVTNLLENSMRYTDTGGRVVVRLAEDGDRAELSIDDSAPGVPEGTHDRLFERLYRADAARTRARGGSGLGLSICKTLVEAHGGSIAAMPSPLGGVRIVVRLPLFRRTAP